MVELPPGQGENSNPACGELTECCSLCVGAWRFIYGTARPFTSVYLLIILRIKVCCCSHSRRYFTALSKGEALPVKERMETPLAKQKEDAGLTPGLLKVLHKQVQTGLWQMHDL